jgi:hypothetical protein
MTVGWWLLAGVGGCRLCGHAPRAALATATAMQLSSNVTLTIFI